MGLITSLKDLGGKIQNFDVGAAAKAEMAAAKYRQGVMYDFSIVNRARFIVYSSDGKMVKILPVQLNPGEISNSTESEVLNAEKLATEDGKNFNIDAKDITGEAEIKLRLDVFDEYMAATANDTLPLEKAPSITDKYSIYKDLENVTSADFIEFVWRGDEKIYGKLTYKNLETECYSRWGDPLKGIYTVKITTIKKPDNLSVPKAVTDAKLMKEKLQAASLLAAEALR